MKKTGNKRLLAFLLVCVMVLGFVPVMAAEGTVTVTLSIDTAAIAADPMEVLGVPQILDGVQTLQVPSGTSALAATEQAAEQFGFALDAPSGFVSAIGWADSSYAVTDPTYGYALGGWTFFVNGQPASVGAGSVPLTQDCTLTWRYSVTGVKNEKPWDYYYDFALLNARARLQNVLKDTQELDASEKTQEISAFIEQGQQSIAELEQAITEAGAEFAYFQEAMAAGGDLLIFAAQTMQDIAYRLGKLLSGEIAVTGITLDKSPITTLKTGQSYQMTAAAEPKDATNQSVVFTTDDPEIATIDAYGRLTAHKSGVAIVKAESAENPAASATCVVIISDRQTPDVTDIISKTASWIAKERGDFSAPYQTAMDWDMFALARCGNLPDQAAQANYLTSLAAFIDEGGLAYPSDVARAILALGAMGIDPSDFAGHDLIADLSAAPLEKQGINAYVFALLALDSGKYQLTDLADTKKELVAAIARLQQADGYFWIQEDWGIDNDLTAMVVCALAPYAKEEPARTVTDRAMEWLAGQQTNEAGFKSWGSENSQTPAQVMAALAALGRDPMTDAAFVKDNKTLYYNICGFLNADGSFGYAPEYIAPNAMATQQVLYCLTAMERYGQNKVPLYDFSDVDITCGEAWLSVLDEAVASAESTTAQGNTKTSYDALTGAVAKAKTVTAEGSKTSCINACLALQAAINGLQACLPITDGKATVDADSVGAIEPKSDAAALEITVRQGAQQAYLELGQVANAMPGIEIVFDDMTLSAAKGNAVKCGPTAVQLPRKPDTGNEAVIEDLNRLLSGSSVREILRRTAVGGDTATVFDDYLTFTFADLGACSAAYVQNGKTVLISTVASDKAGKQYDVYAYRDGTDLVVKSKHTAEFLVFSTKKNSGGSSGSGTPVVRVKVDASAVKGMKVKSKDVPYTSGSTAFSVLETMLGKSAIKTDRAGDYVQGIAIDGKWLSEFDYGPESGWMYSVNGKFIQRPSTEVAVEEGDDVVWVYKTKMDESLTEDDKNAGKPNRGGSSSGSGNQTIQMTDTENQPEEQGKSAFADIADASAWARESVMQAAEQGLMQGYDGKFDPQRNLTRAEWTAVLTRLLDLPMGEATAAFADVPPDAWYARSLAAAVAAGIVTGRSVDCFAPDDSISREELCVMLSRALQTEESTALVFDDAAEIAPWAAGSVAQMVQAGILQGRGDMFDPRGTVTREMAAVVCLRVVEYQK